MVEYVDEYSWGGLHTAQVKSTSRLCPHTLLNPPLLYPRACLGIVVTEIKNECNKGYMHTWNSYSYIRPCSNLTSLYCRHLRHDRFIHDRISSEEAVSSVKIHHRVKIRFLLL